ncbi:MAG: hypothetical protein U0841_17335 [Chloroflexia bacterium]
MPTRERPLSPWVISATLIQPLAIASAAWARWMTNDEPPTDVPSVMEFERGDAGGEEAVDILHGQARLVGVEIGLSGTRPIWSDSATPDNGNLVRDAIPRHPSLLAQCVRASVRPCVSGLWAVPARTLA